MLHYLEGGCSVPVGCETTLVDVSSTSLDWGDEESASPPSKIANMTLTGTITSLSGLAFVIVTESAVVESAEEARALGERVAVELIRRGGRAILEELAKHVKEVGQEEGKEVPFQPRGLPQADAVERSVYLEADACMRPAGW